MRSNWSILLLGLLLGAMLVGLGYANYQFVQRAPGGNDFLARWVGARYWLIEGLSPYDEQVSLAAQEMIYGRAANPSAGEDIAHFVYPLPAMIFFAPFAYLPFPIARTIWMVLLEIALPALALLGVRLAEWKPSRQLLVALMLFSVVWYHGFRSIVVGQFAVIEALIMTGALLAIQRRQDELAGILLAFSLCKPQMPFLLIPFVLLWSASVRRWGVILWTLVGTGILFGLSFVILPEWMLGWLRQLVQYPSYTSIGSPVSIIAGLAPSREEALGTILNAVAVIYLLWEWVRAWRKDVRWFIWTAALTLIITNWIAFRTATTNFVVLLPVLCLVFGVWVRRWERGGRFAVVLMLVILTGGLWALFLLTVEGNIESPWMYLALPAVTLICWWWSRWWAVRETSLQLHRSGDDTSHL
jgi:hypothetical protein